MWSLAAIQPDSASLEPPAFTIHPLDSQASDKRTSQSALDIHSFPTMPNGTLDRRIRSGKDSTPQKTSVGIDFFGLPKEIRINIYRKVLNVPQTYFLFQDGSSRVELFAPERPKWLGLLYTNKRLRDEASAEIYGSNRFSLVDTSQHQYRLLKAFVDSIGPVNAGSLSRLCISFPAAEIREEQPEKIVLRDDDLLSLKLIREKCTKLTTLEAFVHSHNSNALTKVDEHKPHFTRDTLLHIDAQLKSIPSLSRIIVRMYSGTPTPLAMDLMHGFGWVILRGDEGS